MCHLCPGAIANRVKWKLMVADCWLRTKTNTLEARSSRTELIFDTPSGPLNIPKRLASNYSCSWDDILTERERNKGMNLLPEWPWNSMNKNCQEFTNLIQVQLIPCIWSEKIELAWIVEWSWLKLRLRAQIPYFSIRKIQHRKNSSQKATRREKSGWPWRQKPWSEKWCFLI